MLQPLTDLVARYLSDFFPDGPWVLTAIHTDRSGTTTRTFHPDAVAKMTAWVAEMNRDHHNIYYHVGIPKRDLNRKAERADIDKVLWLHVDIDPRNGIDPEICRQQAISALENGKDGIPAPTVIVDSGGGIQAFWRLNDYIEIGGDIAKAEKAKAHNQRLEVVFHSCVDLVMFRSLRLVEKSPYAHGRNRQNTHASSPVLRTAQRES